MNMLQAFVWPISESFVERLGWILVHSLWQFGLVALFARLSVRAMRQSSAAARYGVLLLALAVLVTAPIATWMLTPGVGPDNSVAQRTLDAATTLRTDTSLPYSGSISATDSEFAKQESDHAAAIVAAEKAPAVLPHAPAPVLPEPSWSQKAKGFLRPWLGWIVAGWGAGVVLCSLRPLLAWHMLRRLRREGVSRVSDEVLAAAHRVSQLLGLRRAVQILQSTLAEMPVVVGYVWPIVLLPVSLLASIPVAQLEAILAHELAHVRRHDFVVNLLQVLLETIFFYHPAVWWLSRQIRIEREHCCDDLVVALLGNRVEYVRALVAIEAMRGQNTVLALGAADSSLLCRVRRILGVGADRSAVTLVGRLPAAMLGLGLIGATFALAMAVGSAAKDYQQKDDSLPGKTVLADELGKKDGQGKGPPASEDIFSRKVSLTAKAMPLKDALQSVARQAKVALQVEADALKKVGLDVEQPVTVTIKDEPLAEALGVLINWREHQGVFRKLRGEKLLITTIQAYQANIERQLPQLLKVHYNKGLLAKLDDDNNVVSLMTGEVMSDELLGKLKTLPKLRELDVGPTKLITPAGLRHLSGLSSLQKLSLYSLNHDGKGLGDMAIQQLIGLKSLRELHLNHCGTTDAGVGLLEAMPQLTHVELYAEARLTDSALVSIAKLKRLKHLSLNSYVGTEQGWMRFSKEGTRLLAGLQELEHLHLVGQEISPETLQFPRLKSLSLGAAAVDDACAARIAKCRQLQSLALVYSNITDDGLSKFADLPELSRLTLDSYVVTDNGIKRLKGLPKLQHVSLRASCLTDESLRHLAEIKTLTRIDLHGSGEPGVNAGKCFTIAGVQRLKALPRLRTLWLTNLESDSFLGLKELTQLRELTLMMANIRGDEVEALEKALPNTTINSMSGGYKRLP
jgi:beta-lactamase regulating signal transducer with metallopeptidase domain